MSKAKFTILLYTSAVGVLSNGNQTSSSSFSNVIFSKSASELTKSAGPHVNVLKAI